MGEREKGDYGGKIFDSQLVLYSWDEEDRKERERVERGPTCMEDDPIRPT